MTLETMMGVAVIVVSPAIVGAITIDIRDQPVRKALATMATKMRAVCREGRKGVLHIHPVRTESDPKIRVQFARVTRGRNATPATNEDVAPLITFCGDVRSAARVPVVIPRGLRALIRVRDKRGRPVFFEASTWAEVMEIGLEHSGLMVMERPLEEGRHSGVLVVVPAQDGDRKSHVSLVFVRAELGEVVARIAKHSERTVRIDPKIDKKAKITVHLRGLSWRRSLRAVARALAAISHQGESSDRRSRA